MRDGICNVKRDLVLFKKKSEGIPDKVGPIIRIYQEGEGRIEKSVPRIAICHHEACRVMTVILRDVFFYPCTNNGFFFQVHLV